MGAVNGVVRVSGTRDSDGLGRTHPPPGYGRQDP
jgi:hypothetical protein